jgi:RHS repeat-associated protein
VDLNGSNALQTRYVHGDALDQLFARVSAGGTAAWYLTDRLGSVRNITDNSGVVQDTLTYDPYGNVVFESTRSFGDRFKYTGRELDSETALQYNRARYYDSNHGRWVSQDPMSFGAGDTDLYRYVSNEPVAATDPTGLTFNKATNSVDAPRGTLAWGAKLPATWKGSPEPWDENRIPGFWSSWLGMAGGLLNILDPYLEQLRRVTDAEGYAERGARPAGNNGRPRLQPGDPGYVEPPLHPDPIPLIIVGGIAAKCIRPGPRLVRPSAPPPDAPANAGRPIIPGSGSEPTIRPGPNSPVPGPAVQNGNGPNTLPFERPPTPPPVTPPATPPYSGPPVVQLGPNRWLVGGRIVDMTPPAPFGVFEPNPFGPEVPPPPPPPPGFPRLLPPE